MPDMFVVVRADGMHPAGSIEEARGVRDRLTADLNNEGVTYVIAHVVTGEARRRVKVITERVETVDDLSLEVPRGRRP